LTAVPQEINLQESWRHAVTQRPDLLEQKLRVEQQNVTLKYGFNQLFPELDLTGSYGNNAFDPSLNNTLDNVRNSRNPFYSYGAVVTIPLGNSAARASYKSSKATLKQILLQLKQLEQNIVITVDNDVGQVQSTLQQVSATREARIYAEDALAAEQKKLENGKSTSFQVLQLISNLTAARSSEIPALANYNVALAQLALDEGSTMEKNRIDLKVK
jgi:outer membrane protein TolC